MNSPRDMPAGASAEAGPGAIKTVSQGELDAILARHLRGAERYRSTPTCARVSWPNSPRADLEVRSFGASPAELVNVPAARANLTGAKLSPSAFHATAHLSSLNLDGRDLSEAELTGAKFRFASMKRTRLEMANLFAADLSVADLRGADLSRADMRGACCRGAVLIDATMVETDLREGVLAKFAKGDSDLEVRSFGASPAELVNVPAARANRPPS